MESKTTRRGFLKSGLKAGVGFFIVPSHVISGLGHLPPSDKLNIAGIGVGGQRKA